MFERLSVRACACVCGSACAWLCVCVHVLKANYGSSSSSRSSQEKKSQQVKQKKKKNERIRGSKSCMCSENGQQQLQHVWQVRENYAEKRATKSVEWKSARKNAQKWKK